MGEQRLQHWWSYSVLFTALDFKMCQISMCFAPLVTAFILSLNSNLKNSVLFVWYAPLLHLSTSYGVPSGCWSLHLPLFPSLFLSFSVSSELTNIEEKKSNYNSFFGLLNKDFCSASSTSAVCSALQIFFLSFMLCDIICFQLLCLNKKCFYNFFF